MIWSKPMVFKQDVMDIGEQRMAGVGAENLLVTVHLRLQQSRLLELIQFQPDGIGAFAEFRLQVTQMRPGIGIQEELQQQL